MAPPMEVEKQIVTLMAEIEGRCHLEPEGVKTSEIPRKARLLF